MNPYLDDGDIKLYVGDCKDVLQELPEESVQMVVTSPPYWNLRDYGTAQWEGGDPTCDHSPEKRGGRFANPVSTKQASNTGSGTASSRNCPCGAVREDRQLGMEDTPQEYVANMVEVFREVRRVLRPDGLLFLNIGDTYIGGGKGPGGSKKQQSNQGANIPSGAARSVSGLKPKDLAGIPWRTALALQDDGWWLRSDIIWSKQNPMPSSVTDRPSTSHEYIFMLSKSGRYFYDQVAAMEPAEWSRWGKQTNNKHEGSESAASWIKPATKAQLARRGRRLNADRHEGEKDGSGGFYDSSYEKGLRNGRTVWTTTTEAYSEAHFATFPREIPRKCIKAGTSEKGCCPKCGAPWARIVTVHEGGVQGDWNPRDGEDPRVHNSPTGQKDWNSYVPPKTVGWEPTCSCGVEYTIPCVVMDPFGGAGTTGFVAREMGRRSVLVELSPDYADLTASRLQQLSLLA